MTWLRCPDGFHLPDQYELAAIWCHANDDTIDKNSVYNPQADAGCEKAGISNSVDNLDMPRYYWSSSAGNDEDAITQMFTNGFQFFFKIDNECHFRCVSYFCRGI